MKSIKEINLSKEFTAMRITSNNSGSLAACFGQNSLLVINLNNFQTHKKVIFDSLNGNDILFGSWSNSKENYLAVSLSNVCNVYNHDLVMLFSSKRHKTSITSLDWHPTSPSVLVSCSLDNSDSLCIWDLRLSENSNILHRNAQSSSCIDNTSGYHLVRWSKGSGNYILTALGPEGSVGRIWDSRNLSASLTKFSLDNKGLYDLDYLPNSDNSFISCGADKVTKLWQIHSSYQPKPNNFDDEYNNTHSKFDNLGKHIITMSKQSKTKENHISIHNYPLNSDLDPLMIGSSISDSFVDFSWKNSETNKEFVTLQSNNIIKLWSISTNQQQMDRLSNYIYSSTQRPINFHSKIRSTLSSDGVTNTGKKSSFVRSPEWEQSSRHSRENKGGKSIPSSLESGSLGGSRRSSRGMTPNESETRIIKELSNLINTPQVIFDTNISEYFVVAHFSLIQVKCSIKFEYIQTNFNIYELRVIMVPGRTEKIRPQNIEELDKILCSTINEHKHRDNRLIDLCVEVVLEYLNKLSTRLSSRTIRTMKEGSNSGPSIYNLPEVKFVHNQKCRASFSPSGHLICFVSASPRSIGRTQQTSRTLIDSATVKSGLYDFTKNNLVQLKQVNKVNKKLTNEYEYNSSKLTNGNKSNYSVYIYNFQPMSLFSLDLARKYCINPSDIRSMCNQNYVIASGRGRKDLIEFWQFCKVLANGCDPSINKIDNLVRPWPSHLFGQKMCYAWLKHFTQLNDIQSASMFILVLLMLNTNLRSSVFGGCGTNEYSTVIGGGSDRGRNSSQESLLCPENTNNVEYPSVASGFVNIFNDGHIDGYTKQFKIFEDSSTVSMLISNSYDNSSKFRTNSWDERNQHKLGVPSQHAPSLNTELMNSHIKQCILIDEKEMTHFSLILLNYCHLLKSHNLLTVSTMIMQKFMPNSAQLGCSVEEQTVSLTQISSNQPDLDETLTTSNLTTTEANCKLVYCSVCRLLVRGLLLICSECHHGGHVDHLRIWFSKFVSPLSDDTINVNGYCATGCGCHCCFQNLTSGDDSNII